MYNIPVFFPFFCSKHTNLNMYNIPVFSIVDILVLICTTYTFFHYSHISFNMVCHAADMKGVSCTDKSREGKNESTVVCTAAVQQ